MRRLNLSDSRLRSNIEPLVGSLLDGTPARPSCWEQWLWEGCPGWVLLVLEWRAAAAEPEEMFEAQVTAAHRWIPAKSKGSPEGMDDLDTLASAALQGRTLLFLRRMGGGDRRGMKEQSDEKGMRR